MLSTKPMVTVSRRARACSERPAWCAVAAEVETCEDTTAFGPSGRGEEQQHAETIGSIAEIVSTAGLCQATGRQVASGPRE